MIKKDSMKDTTDQELLKLLLETREILRTERFAAAGARPKDPNSPGKLRKVIARVLTEQHSRNTSTAVSASSGSRPTT